MLMKDGIEGIICRHKKIALVTTIVLSFMTLTTTLWSAYPLHTTTDELGAIVGAATFAGYDWRTIIGRSGYYGFGFYSLYAPLFMLKLSPILIYRIVLVTTRLFRASIICSVVYYIGRKYLMFESNFGLLAVALICSIPLHLYDASNIINDIMLDAIMWLIILAGCKMIEHLYEHLFYQWLCIFFILNGYILLLHTRAIVVPAITSLLLLVILGCRKNLKALFLLFMAPVCVGVNYFIHVYQTSIYSGSGELRNAYVSISKGLKFNDIDLWEIWGRMLVGHITVQNLLTGGLFVLAFVAGIRNLYVVILGRKEINGYELLIWGSSVLAIAAVFGAFLISSWTNGMYRDWNEQKRGVGYAYKAMCYVRYWNVFSQPLLFMGIHWELKNKGNKGRAGAMLLYILVVVLFLQYVYPVVKDNSSAAVFLIPFKTDVSEVLKKDFYLKAILISLTVWIISYIIIQNDRWKQYALVPALMLVLVGYVCGNINYNKPVREAISSMVLASYFEKCELEKNGIKLGNVYAIDEGEKDDNWYIYSVLQFYFYDMTIKEGYPISMMHDDVIITTKRNAEIEERYDNIKCYLLDDNEVWYTDLEIVGYEPVNNT